MGDIRVQLSSPVLKRSSRLFAATVRCLLQAIVLVNRMALRSDKSIPPLYASGVVFGREKQGHEAFRDLTSILKTGKGDCEDLATWRVAELQETGENAELRIQWIRTKRGTRLFHVVVRRGDGSVEDPSKLLGMNKNSAG